MFGDRSFGDNGGDSILGEFVALSGKKMKFFRGSIDVSGSARFFIVFFQNDI
jgi:hypothetical protein